MNNARNSILSFEKAINISSSNLQNSSTTGYKKLTYSFASEFNRVINKGSAGSITVGGTNPIQLGGGSVLSGVSGDFSDGELASGGKLDVAIRGSGFFMLSGDKGQTFTYTRNGAFSFNAEGFLVDKYGKQVYGFAFNNGKLVRQLVPIRCINNTKVGWKYKGHEGILVENYLEKENAGNNIYQLALTDFPNRQGLVAVGQTEYMESKSSGLCYEPGIAFENGLGEAMSGVLEKSNVSIIEETINLQELQRAMNASLTALKMASDQISKVIDILGN